MKDNSRSINKEIRKLITDYIVYYSRSRAERLEEALNEKSKYARVDSIMNLLRDAVKCSPIVMFNGVPHVFDGQKYVRMTWNDLSDSLYDAMRRLGVKDGDYGRVDAIAKTCMRAVTDREYSIDNSIVVMNNGVFDTKDFTLHKYSSSYMTNSSVDYSYDENEVPVLFNKFLDEVLPDIGMQMALQEYVGATFVDRTQTKLETLCILFGSGSNGKSVVFEVVMAMLGDDNVSTFSIGDLINKGQRQMNLASINGKRLNYCSEIRTVEIGAANADAFKSLVSGEPVMARQIYGENFKATAIPLIMANANTLPKLTDSSYGLIRRLMIIPFNRTIDTSMQNKNLATELKLELSGIFNWAMQGLKRLRENKYEFSVTSEMEKIVDDYVNDNNIIYRFTKDKMYFSRWYPETLATPEWKAVNNIYNEFCQWCVSNGEVVAKTKQQFVSDFAALGYQKTRHSNGVGFSVYRCVSREEEIMKNLDIALSLKKKNGSVVNADAIIESNGRQKVLGVNNVEHYLGLRENSLWKYFAQGLLELTYENTIEGPLFDVVSLQKTLAELGYYVTVNRDPDRTVVNSLTALKKMRTKFNRYMKSRRLPFRMSVNELSDQYGNTHTIVVPDGWFYNEKNAEGMIKIHKYNETEDGKD